MGTTLRHRPAPPTLSLPKVQLANTMSINWCQKDREMSEVACEMGFGTGVFPELKLTHLIPKERTSIHYLLKVYEGSQTSRE